MIQLEKGRGGSQYTFHLFGGDPECSVISYLGTLRITMKDERAKCRFKREENQERYSLVRYQRRLEDARGGEHIGGSTEDFWDSDETDDFADL